MNGKGLISNNSWALKIAVALLLLVLLIHYQNNTPLNQELQSVVCSSGTCSDPSLTITNQTDLARETVIGGYVCDDTKDAEGYIKSDHDYDKYYLFNRDNELNNEVFNEKIGAHSGLKYVLYKWDSEKNKYVDTGSVKELNYGDNDYFEVDRGTAYRIDVYYCDLPEQLNACSETDEGIDSKTRSVTTTNYGAYEDYCSSKTTLEEYYCDGSYGLGQKTISCDENTRYGLCVEGACSVQPFYKIPLYQLIISSAFGLLLIGYWVFSKRIK